MICSARIRQAVTWIACVLLAGAAHCANAQSSANLQFDLGTLPTATLPLDGGLKHRFKVRNAGTTDIPILHFTAAVVETNQDIPIFPQPQQISLPAGAEMTVVCILDSANGNLAALPPGQNTRTVKFTFQTSPNDSVSVSAAYSITVLPTPWNGGGPLTVSGTVGDANGSPVSGAIVSLSTPNMLSPLTSASPTGTFSFSVPVRDDWMLTATAPGRARVAAFVDPSRNAPYTLRLAQSAPAAPTITATQEIQGAMGFWRGDVTADGQSILLTNGMEIWSDPSLKSQSKLYRYRIDGTKTWEYAMGMEAWAASISRDGAYAAYATLQPDLFSAPTLGLLDGTTGKLLWQQTIAAPRFQFTDWPAVSTREIRISNTNRYLAVGTSEGFGYMLDLATGSIRWSARLTGQIRAIRFSADDSSVYFGSDPWLVKYNAATGAELWRANISSWPLGDGMALTPDGAIVATIGKTGDVTAVRTSDGTRLWTRDLGTIGQFLVMSADGTRITTAPFGSIWVLDTATGNVIWRTPPPAKHAVFAPDGSVWAFQNLFDRNGQLLAAVEGDFNPPVGQFSYVSPNGARLVAANGEISQPGNVIVFYDVSPSLGSTATNDTALWWNPNESGWGLNVVHQGNTLFATMFNYAKAGLGTQNPFVWFVGSAVVKQPEGSFSGPWYQVAGPSFDANPFTPIGAAQITQVGTVRLAFSGDSGTLTYSVNGVTVTKSIAKQVFGVAPAFCTFTDNTDRSSATNYQDLWWNPNESGWGINFSHQYTPDRGEILFATLFSYQKSGQGNQNPPAWYVGPALVKQSDGSFSGTLYETTGSAFDANPFLPLTSANLAEVGTMRFTPTDGQTATLTYTVNGTSVTKAITRQVYQSPVNTCTTMH